MSKRRTIADLVADLESAYEKSCIDVSETTDIEPRIQCQYCGAIDVGPAHLDGCIAVLCIEAAVALDRD